MKQKTMIPRIFAVMLALILAIGSLPLSALADDPQLQPYGSGDVDGNGYISPADARLALRASVKLEVYPVGSETYNAADMDQNGMIESADARLILRTAVGLETTDLPIDYDLPEEGSDGWIFSSVNETGDGCTTVDLRFEDCVGLTSGKLYFFYDTDIVQGISYAPGADADIANALGNHFNSELNTNDDGAVMKFYFKNALWDTETWMEKTGEEGIDTAPCGEDFAFASMTFAAEEQTEIMVYGEVIIDGTAYYVGDWFFVGGQTTVSDGNVVFNVLSAENGVTRVGVRLINCVGLTGGEMNFTYDEDVTGISKINSEDVHALVYSDVDNDFSSSFYFDEDAARFGFHFEKSLWSSEEWEEAAAAVGSDLVIDGEDFECAVLLIEAEPGAEIAVHGSLRINDEEYAFADVISIPDTIPCSDAKVAFDVGEYSNGCADISVRLVNCVGMTSCDLKFGYQNGKVTEAVLENGADAQAVIDSRIENGFYSDFCDEKNPLGYGFYFIDSLWGSAEWAEAMDNAGRDAQINGENFETAVLTLSAESGTMIFVSGELRMLDGSVVTVSDSFMLGEPASAGESRVTLDVDMNSDGEAQVSVCLTDCIGLSSGKLSFACDDDQVVKFTAINGADAKAVKAGGVFKADGSGNGFEAECNEDIRPAQYGFYFHDNLWNSADWANMMTSVGLADAVNAENFEIAVLNVTGKSAATITVTGELHMKDGAVVEVNESVLIPFVE